VNEENAAAIGHVIKTFTSRVRFGEGPIGEQPGQPLDDALRVVVDVIDCRSMIEPNQHHSLLASFNH